MTEPARGPQEALAALERLYQRKVVTLDEAQAAARAITGDANAMFPPPAPEKAPPAPPAAEPAPAAQPAPEPATEGSSDPHPPK